MQPSTNQPKLSGHATLALQMQRCYDVTRRLYGIKFDESISVYRTIIINYRKEHNKNTLHSIIDILSEKETRENASWIMMFMAAGVSLLNEEPEN